MNLTDHFTFDDLVRSETATTLGITEQANPSADVVNAATKLCQQVLEPLRASISAQQGSDCPLFTSSFYRCTALNKAVGGVADSQHLTGEAADIYSNALNVDDLYAFIKNGTIAFDQLIIEHDSAGHRWVHVSYSFDGAERGTCMIGTLLPTGGTSCVDDGLGKFKTA
jgi:zinc D-Ala-D-Ala carboxypeptidase